MIADRNPELPPELERYAADAESVRPPASIETILSESGFPVLTKDSNLDEIERVLRELASRVNGVDPLRRVTIRAAAKNRLQALGVKASDSLVRRPSYSTAIMTTNRASR